MKPNEEQSELTQLNARVPVGMKRTVKAIAVATDVKIEEITADAFRFFFGVECPNIQKRRRAALDTFQKLTKGAPLPFDGPATPFTNNDHNGIVGVPGSSPGGSTISERLGHGREIIGEYDPAVESAGRDKSANGVPFSTNVGFKPATPAFAF